MQTGRERMYTGMCHLGPKGIAALSVSAELEEHYGHAEVIVQKGAEEEVCRYLTELSLEDDAFIQVEKALKPIYKQAASLVKRKGRASSEEANAFCDDNGVDARVLRMDSVS